MVLSLEKIEALAPDQAALGAARKLLKATTWPTLACDNAGLVWGEAQGSGATPYRVVISEIDAGYKCTCPSRKFPCKHSLALMWIRAEGKLAFATGSPPQWVNDWLSRRRGPSLATPAAGTALKASLALAVSGELAAAAADPKTEARAAAQRERNRQDREATILAGLDELDLWLSDQVERGIAAFLANAASACRQMAQRLMHGLSTRTYKEVVQQFSDAYALDKSTVSEHFIEASRKKLEMVMTRSLAQLSICTMMIDGTIFKGCNLVVAIGIDRFGHKIVLGLRQGATENAAVVGELLEELAERGLDFTQPRLYVVDGGKAIRRAILNHAGEAAFVQRCQVHKIRNVCDHLAEGQQHAVRYQLRCAYEMTEAADAKRALLKLHDDLVAANPSAAASLVEGLEETLTVLELRVSPKLRRSIASTNGIESSFSVTERICRQVKRWQGSDHRLRWVASTLLFAESRWNRLQGYNQIEALVSAMKTAHALRLQKQKAALRRQLGAA